MPRVERPRIKEIKPHPVELDPVDFVRTEEYSPWGKLVQSKPAGVSPDSPPTVPRQSPDSVPRHNDSPPTVSPDSVPRQSPDTYKLHSPTVSPDSPPTTLCKKRFSDFVKTKRSILINLFLMCSIESERKTSLVQYKQLATLCGTNEVTIEQTIRRLIRDFVIKKCGFIPGQNGGVFYEIEEAIFNEMFILNSEGVLRQLQNSPPTVSPDSPPTVPRHCPPTNSHSYSNSSLEINTISRKDFKYEDLPLEWKNIDLYPMKNAGIPFSEDNLIDLCASGVSTRYIQSSIDHFVFDVTKNNKYVVNKKEVESGIESRQLEKDALNILTGILRKGRPYTAPANYKTPEQIELEEEMQRHAEAMSTREKIDSLVKERKQAEFEIWRSRLSEVELAEILETHGGLPLKAGGPMTTNFLFSYFSLNVFKE